jgi:hypothetical protein
MPLVVDEETSRDLHFTLVANVGELVSVAESHSVRDVVVEA